MNFGFIKTSFFLSRFYNRSLRLYNRRFKLYNRKLRLYNRKFEHNFLLNRLYDKWEFSGPLPPPPEVEVTRLNSFIIN